MKKIGYERLDLHNISTYQWIVHPNTIEWKNVLKFLSILEGFCLTNIRKQFGLKIKKEETAWH